MKNGKKKNGSQNYLCRNCGKQFISEYQLKGSNPETKKFIIRMLENNSGIRDVERVVNVSRKCVLNTLTKTAKELKITNIKTKYSSVQIDELWSYVHKRKEGKQWFIYAYAPETGEILDFVIGDRSRKTVKKLYKKIQHLDIKQICTDPWRAFQQVFPTKIHKSAKNIPKI